MKCKKCSNQIGNNFNYCNKCGEPLKDELVKQDNKPQQELENINFFIVSTQRLVLFSVLSFGLYSVYWFGRNFSAISKHRKARGKDTNYVLWGIFNVLTADILFYEFYLLYEKATGKKFKIPSGVFSLLYFLGMVAGRYIFLSPFVFIATALIFQEQLRKYQYIGLYNYSKEKFSWKELIIVVLGLLLTISSLNTYITNDKSKGDIKLTYSVMQEIANETNKDLPKMLDSETRIDKVTGAENSLTYSYTLVNYDVSELDRDSFTSKVKPSLITLVCTNPDMQVFVKNKSIINYLYNDKNGLFFENISVNTDSDCQ